jgi:uncharacterized repeat protein (TIGR02543 family)
LTAGTAYFFQVAAVTQVGRGAYSLPSKVVTPSGLVTVTFNANGGSGTMANEIEPYDTTAALTLNAFNYGGYTFTGWNTAPNGGGIEFANGALAKFNGNATFYAQWEDDSMAVATVTFNANGGIGSMPPETEGLNITAKLTTNTFTRAGYSFSGWNTTKSGSGAAYANDADYSFGASVTLFAQWSAVPTATLVISPNNLASVGGIAILTYSSQNAITCTLSSSPSIWTSATESVDCNGTYSFNVASATSSHEWTFTFTASNASGQSTTSTQILVESAPSTTPQFSNSSPNWSGYVVPSSTDLVTDAQGDWTVPTMNCGDTPNGDSSAWVGIGGEQWATGGFSGVLLQTGTGSDCVDGVQENSAWWEEYPSSPNHEVDFSDFTVFAGDEIEAFVFQTRTGAWATKVTDLNTGLTGFMITGDSWGVGLTSASTFSIQGSTAGLSYSGAYTAEWIVEDTGVAATPGTYFPLANFGSVTFSDLESSFTTWSLTPAEEWGIVQDGVTLAAPTSSTLDGFTVTYVGP